MKKSRRPGSHEVIIVAPPDENASHEAMFRG